MANPMQPSNSTGPENSSHIATQSVWEAELVRFTTFHAADVPNEELPTFESLIGRKAELYEERPNLSERNETVTLGAGTFQRRCTAGRVDWLWFALVDPTDGAPQHPSLGLRNEVMDQFAKLVEPWILSRADIVRIAIGGNFIIPMPNRDEAYKLINDKVSFVKLDPKRMAEFNLQINFPVAAEVNSNSINLNRFFKWGARRRLLSTFVTAVGGAHSKQKTVESIDVVCEADINTVLVPQQILAVKDLSGILGLLKAFMAEALEANNYE